jgi:hypothetical protein
MFVLKIRIKCTDFNKNITLERKEKKEKEKSFSTHSLSACNLFLRPYYHVQTNLPTDCHNHDNETV